MHAGPIDCLLRAQMASCCGASFSTGQGNFSQPYICCYSSPWISSTFVISHRQELNQTNSKTIGLHLLMQPFQKFCISDSL